MVIGKSGMEELVKASKKYADEMDLSEEQKHAFEEFVKKLMHWTLGAVADVNRIRYKFGLFEIVNSEQGYTAFKPATDFTVTRVTDFYDDSVEVIKEIFDKELWGINDTLYQLELIKDNISIMNDNIKKMNDDEVIYIPRSIHEVASYCLRRINELVRECNNDEVGVVITDEAYESMYAAYLAMTSKIDEIKADIIEHRKEDSEYRVEVSKIPLIEIYNDTEYTILQLVGILSVVKPDKNKVLANILYAKINELYMSFIKISYDNFNDGPLYEGDPVVTEEEHEENIRNRK